MGGNYTNNLVIVLDDAFLFLFFLRRNSELEIRANILIKKTF